MNWQNFQKILSELKTKRRTRFIFPWWILNLAAATDPTENPYWTFGRRSYHHYPRYLLNFDSLRRTRTKSIIENPKKTTIWPDFWRYPDGVLPPGWPVTRSFPIPLFEEEFWAIQQESCPRKEKVRNAFELKNYRKNPARFFWREIDLFSHSFSRYTPADLEL